MTDKTKGYVIDRGGNLVSMARNFLQMEAAGGIVLVAAAAVALIIANSPLYPFYHYVLEEVYFRIGFTNAAGAGPAFEKSVLHWINDGLMVIFFFLIGLEIKREVLEGELSSCERALLPLIGAIGGMAAPAAVFWFINRGSPETMSGWAIPSATDIAFALGVLALLGSRIPLSLKVLLTAIAVIDDLGAIIIIALFYSKGLAVMPLMVAGGAIAVLFAMNRMGVSRKAAYILVGFVLWAGVLESGVHATLAGVIVALFIPLRCRKNPDYSPSKTLEHNLHPWVAFGILPAFGFANAGVPFTGMGLHSLFSPVTLGIALGLFVGKQVGIFSALWLAIATGLSPKPEGASWIQLYGLAALCGIGFTMSLFIGSLAYAGDEMQASVRLGVLVGSLSAAALGYLVLRCAPSSKNPS